MAKGGATIEIRSNGKLLHTLELLRKPVITGGKLANYNKEINRELDNARKRWDRLVKNGLESTEAFKKFGKQGRFSLKGKTGEARLREIERAANFLNQSSSTISGAIESSKVDTRGLSAKQALTKIRNVEKLKPRIVDAVVDALRKAEGYDSSQAPQYIERAIGMINADLASTEADLQQIEDRILNELGIAPNGWEPVTGILGGNNLFTPKR